MLSEAMIRIRGANEAQARASGIEAGCPFSKRQAKGITPPFDAAQQYVSNQGEHAFVPPSGIDQRGPCMLAAYPDGSLAASGRFAKTSFLQAQG
jgi:hypothetical protein